MVPDHNAAFASYTGSTSTVRNTRQTGGTALVAATSFAGQSVQSPTGDLKQIVQNSSVTYFQVKEKEEKLQKALAQLVLLPFVSLRACSAVF